MRIRGARVRARERESETLEKRGRGMRRGNTLRGKQIDSRDGETKEREKGRKEKRTLETKRKSEQEGERSSERERRQGGRGLCAGWCKHIAYWHQHQHAKIDRHI